jgi:hypothetical protein
VEKRKEEVQVLKVTERQEERKKPVKKSFRWTGRREWWNERNE